MPIGSRDMLQAGPPTSAGGARTAGGLRSAGPPSSVGGARSTSGAPSAGGVPARGVVAWRSVAGAVGRCRAACAERDFVVVVPDRHLDGGWRRGMWLGSAVVPRRRAVDGHAGLVARLQRHRSAPWCRDDQNEAEQCNESYLNPCPAGQKRRFTVTTEPRRCHKCPGCEHRALERGRDLSRPLVMWDVFGTGFSGSNVTVEADPVVTCAFVCVAMLEESSSRKQSIH